MSQINKTIFENSHYLILDKPSGVHFDNLVQDEAWEAGHRLDFGTSGCLVFVPKGFGDKFRESLRKIETKKIYIAGASYSLGDAFKSEALIRGQIASRYRSSKKVSFYPEGAKTKARSLQAVLQKVVELENGELRAEDYRGLDFGEHKYEVSIQTGARHQIRAFFASMGSPLRGDSTYGGEEAKRLELHAALLRFMCPWSHQEIEVRAKRGPR